MNKKILVLAGYVLGVLAVAVNAPAKLLSGASIGADAGANTDSNCVGT